MSLPRTIATGRPLRRSGGLLTGAILVAALAAGAVAAAVPAAADTAAVVIMYHRFGEPKYPSTNITLEQFEAHIQELQSGKYRVVGLPEIIAALRDGRPLPDRTVGLSIDDAFRSVYREAWPRLKEAGFPFTLFVATGPIDRKASNYMNWDQIREMAAAGVTIGSQTMSHLHMADASPERNRDDLDRSNRRFEEELGQRPDLFAYPYGESSLAVQTLVKEMNFTAAFGQHSGAIGGGGDLFDLPRFAMNETYGGQPRFRLAVNALPLPVTDVTPADPLIAAHNPPAMGFTIAGNIPGLDRLACYSSHEGRARLEHLGGNRIEIRVERAFPKGRTRVNCTLPVGKGRFRWFGRQFYRGPS
ncbi:MAG: polysaccharide deacetylase family protein [Proteobacteria bacterium]|nr:polysaccharide deacetylase family protein [Pseudomonadota bacterium]